jgi:hypothetical protein
MRIISIDVGIKNLAYCILETVPQNANANANANTNANANDINILQWDVLNLCGEEHLCNCALKPKKKIAAPIPDLCKKKASFQHGDTEFFCQTHAKQSNYLFPTSTLKKIKTWKREALIAYATAQGVQFPALENVDANVDITGMKKDVLLKHIQAYVNANVLAKISTLSANEMTLIQMGVTLLKVFDEQLDLTAIDHIVIENQISPIANRMKTLQGMIAQYFIMRGNAHIAFISSANKLKLFTTDIKTKTTYGERKKAGVIIVKDLLTKQPAWLQLFLTHKKKDDLADAFLQGVWYLASKKV